MPFVQRVVEPKYLSKTSLHDENNKPIVNDCELEAVTNNTLSNALRQLASLVLVANDIFIDLTKQLENVQERSRTLKTRIQSIGDRVSHFDPKKVTVPESDISTFALLRDHYTRKHDLSTGLFNSATRPRCVRALYSAAAKTPIHTMRQMDRWRRDGHRTSRYFLCTPVLGAKRRKIRENIDMDIETRMPAAVEELRRWTSDEALGDITVPPDCVTRITANTTSYEDQIDTGATSGDEGIDHKLPSPEEQVIAIANKFPAEIVAVDVSQKRFNRMCAQRRSLLHVEVSSRGGGGGGGGTSGTTAPSATNTGGIESVQNTATGRSRTRKPRAKRRNTIAGTDQKEIQEAIFAGEEASTSANTAATTRTLTKEKSKVVTRSKSSDLLRTKKDPPSDSSSGGQHAIKKSHFNSLKQWGKNRLKMINKSFESKSNNSSGDTFKIEDIDDVNIYETVTVRRRKNIDKSTNNIETSMSSNKSIEKTSNIPISTPITGAMSMAVKLRESAAQRRQRRNGINKDEPHSSSGNWSASSESGRTSIGSEITTSTTTQPKSTTSCTSGTSSNSLLPSSTASRRKFVNTSNSSSVTSEGTLTPDIIHDLHGDDDGESSVYSCDTEGYYTSFHVDSGLKTLKEEDVSSLPSTPLQVTSALRNMSAESEYELFGKGSTSTTTSSAGTVCTTLMASGSQRSLLNSGTALGPAVPERKSSLEATTKNENTGTIKRNMKTSALIHKGDESPDSGHNTSSSPIESINSPNGQRSFSEFEYSESSDLEGVDRIERIRLKTTINSSRIPSMCVITPPHSEDDDDDDGSVKSVQRFEIPTKLHQKTPSEHSTESEQETTGPSKHSRAALPPPMETDIDADLILKPVENRYKGTKKVQLANINPETGYATVETPGNTTKVTGQQPLLKSTLQPLNNMFGKLRTNISNLTHRKTPPKEMIATNPNLFDSGEYVTIADVRNNNNTSGIYYANDVVKRNLDNILSGQVKDTEYVSLNELPTKLECPDLGSLERKRRQGGARVTLDADGKVVYSSDSLRRRKGAHTTFEPGPFVKDVPQITDSPLLRTPKLIRPVSTSSNAGDPNHRPLSPQMGKVVIRATSKSTFGGSTPPPTADFIRMPPSTVVTPLSPKVISSSRGIGAYVNMQDHTSTTTTTTSSSGMTTLSGQDEGPALFKYNNPADVRSPVDQQYIMEQPIQQQQLYTTQHLNRFGGYDRSSPIYRTLPTRKPPNLYPEVEPQRSVTPDITRGLQQHSPRDDQKVFTPTSKQSKIPMGISNFFSPIKEKPKMLTTDSPKISPIDPRSTGHSFKSSTPTKSTELKAATNLTSKLVPPKKSTMSYDELYAVIHKSKKKFGLQSTETVEKQSRDRHSWSPNNSETSQISTKLSKETTGAAPGSRQSWAYTADRRIPVPKTSTMDFKRLLLQHGSKSIPTPNAGSKLSAVEQLKLSKPQTPAQSSLNILDLSSSPRSLSNRKQLTNNPGSPRHQVVAGNIGSDKQRVVPKLMLSPRSAWRFASPRSDVLSSTILEDCREDENSPNSTSSSLDSKDKKSLVTTTLNVVDPIIESVDHQTFETKTSGDNGDKNSNNTTSCLAGGMTRAQYMQAQKAQFFLSGSTATVVQISTPLSQETQQSTKCPSPPALETAL